MSARIQPGLLVRWLLVLLFAIGSLLHSPIALQAMTVQAMSQAAPQLARSAAKNPEEVQKAVVRIVATGAFKNPGEKEQISTSSGSGFFIDPSGIIVTNNHVVTGAALLKVYVEGEEKPHNAKVLGVSECADLAVIAIDAIDGIDGNDYPYLDWYSEPLKARMPVYTAGFPLGDPEFTWSDGVIAKTKANGQASWSSIEYVLQHSADMLPGSSGGPLVSEDGQVVGVNYRGNAQNNLYFAIPAALAKPIVQELRKGNDLDTLGINGEAFSNGKDFSGIWITSLKTGSPAEDAGIKPGDILLEIENLTLASDGTMRTYCDILRSHDSNDVLRVQLLRIAQDGSLELWEGQLNGTPVKLQETIQVNQPGGGETPAPQSSDSTPQGELITWTDSTETLSVDTPAAWKDGKGDDWFYNDQVIGRFLMASTDLAGFDGGWTTPGVLVGASTALADWSHQEVLETFADQGDACKRSGPFDYEDNNNQGIYYLWTNCNNNSTLLLFTLSLSPKQSQQIKLMIHVQLLDVVDSDAAAQLTDQIVTSIVLHKVPANESSTNESGTSETSSQTSTVREVTETPAATPTFTPVPPTPVPANPVAVVLINQLNVRSGPGTNYTIIGSLNAGARLPVRGQVYNCAWLQVQLPNQNIAWVSGGAQYTSLEGSCSVIPAVAPPPVPTARPRAPASSGVSPGSGSSQGCYIFRNYISAELTVTFTSGDGRQNQTFKVASKGSHYICFAPGRYTVTVDAPPPWGSMNTSVDITPGMYEEWPVWGEN